MNCGAPPAHAQHAVVAAHDDVAVVQQQRVGDAAQPPQRLVVVDHQRLAAGVGAGHHQQQRPAAGPARPCRRAGPPPRGTAASAAACTAASRPAHAGPARRRPARRRRSARIGSSTIGRSATCSSARSAGVGVHPGLRPTAGWPPSPRRAFPRAACAGAARATAAALRASQARWKPPSPLMATMRPARSSASVRGDRVAADRPALGIAQRQRRPAHRAGIGLGVEAAVQRIACIRAGTPGTARSRPCWSCARS